MKPSALLITGTVGSGKTSVVGAIGDQLAAAGVPHAVIDLDWLRRAWPSPPGDRFNLAVTLANLRPMAQNFLCRLLVDLPTVRARLIGRHDGDAGLAWHLARSGELDAILRAAHVEDFTVDASDRSVADVAAAVLRAAGGDDPLTALPDRHPLVG